jgi:hypothetical protein
MIFDYRDLALDLVDNGRVSKDDLIIMLLKYMSFADIHDCLKSNELIENNPS